jgi:hypothetical protein
VQFEIVHEFDIPLDAVELAFLSPSLGSSLVAKLPHVESLEQKSHVVDEDRLERVWAFRANVKIPAFAQKYVTPEMCAWEETTVYDIRRHAASWRVRAQVKPEWQKFFASSGSYLLESLDAGRSRRTVRGTLDVNVQLVGTMAEKLIYSELVKKTFEAEAAALRELATVG